MKQTIDQGPTASGATVPVCNYEGSNYRTDFWEGQGREYEDGVERVALKALLTAPRPDAQLMGTPAAGASRKPAAQTLIELGGGYGRLADLYGTFQHVILTDRAFTQVQQARQRLGGDPRFGFVVADIYALPFRAESAGHIVSVRMLHHLVDVPLAFAEIARVVAAGGTYITEFASKRHLKAIARHALGMQRADPFAAAPHEFAALNFDFHPRWMEAQLRKVGLVVDARRAVSHFRVGLLKRTVPVGVLVGADRALQRIGGWWPWTPSIFVRARKSTNHEDTKAQRHQDTNTR